MTLSEPSPVPPPVSVIIPAYDRAASIRQAIESVLRQTWTDFELIVVDDGSSDGTLAAAAEVRDPRLRLVESPRNAGAAAARNRGAGEARGTWLAFQDSDDEWLPEKLGKQMARLAEPAGYVAAYCGLLTLGGLDPAAEARLGLRYVPDPAVVPAEGDLREPLLRGNLVSTQTLVVRRDVFLGLGGFDAGLPALEDWDFALRLAARGPIALVDEPLVQQRFSPNSLTRSLDRHVRAHDRIVEKHLALYEGRPDLLALQYYSLAGSQRRAGNLAEARRYLGLARRSHPANPRPWAMSLWLALRGAAVTFRGGRSHGAPLL
jgi:glycosyltransferase involved in cell wall biosynthesis